MTGRIALVVPAPGGRKRWARGRICHPHDARRQAVGHKAPLYRHGRDERGIQPSNFFPGGPAGVDAARRLRSQHRDCVLGATSDADAGPTPVVLATGQDFPIALVVDNTNVFWIKTDAIMRCAKGGCSQSPSVVNNTSVAVAIASEQHRALLGLRTG